eukprot:GHVN01081794.1.p1 GENE.GHVN01081794.1~~GHVN01081794.1.p1  ORF type:complete len:494 (+),score=65.55 GHVN01081794.1:213-1484(+)
MLDPESDTEPYFEWNGFDFNQEREAGCGLSFRHHKNSTDQRTKTSIICAENNHAKCGVELKVFLDPISVFQLSVTLRDGNIWFENPDGNLPIYQFTNLLIELANGDSRLKHFYVSNLLHINQGRGVQSIDDGRWNRGDVTLTEGNLIISNVFAETDAVIDMDAGRVEVSGFTLQGTGRPAINSAAITLTRGHLTLNNFKALHLTVSGTRVFITVSGGDTSIGNFISNVDVVAIKTESQAGEYNGKVPINYLAARGALYGPLQTYVQLDLESACDFSVTSSRVQIYAQYDTFLYDFYNSTSGQVEVNPTGHKKQIDVTASDTIDFTVVVPSRETISFTRDLGTNTSRVDDFISTDVNAVDGAMQIWMGAGTDEQKYALTGEVVIGPLYETKRRFEMPSPRSSDVRVGVTGGVICVVVMMTLLLG